MPKEISGCHNCSQRRIKCDQTRPHCNKCLRKGLECPGYGIRYRFNQGVASRGKLKGRKLVVEESVDVPGNGRPVAAALLWPDGSVTQNKPSDGTENLDQSNSPAPSHVSGLTGQEFGEMFTPSTTFEIAEEADEMDNDDVGLLQAVTVFQDQGIFSADARICKICNSTHPPGPCQLIVPTSLEIIGSQSRELFAHFSASVAPVMVVLDGEFNGYRNLILPLAYEDSLVKAAVSVVSMYHLAPQRPEMQAHAEAGFQAIIQHLRQRTSLKHNLLDISAWTTIIVLLTGETITGGTNLPYLFKILQHLADANTSSGQESVMHSFLKEQTHMMTLFAQPLLGESAGTMTLRARPDTYFDFISNAAIFFPRLAPQIDLYKAAIRRACNLYLTRVIHGPPHSETVGELESLKALCGRIHPSMPGHHTLVWVYFVAAAESSTLAHRDFFTMRLREVFSMTRFHNIPIALKALQELWKVQAERRWTEILPQVMPVFII